MIKLFEIMWNIDIDVLVKLETDFKKTTQISHTFVIATELSEQIIKKILTYISTSFPFSKDTGSIAKKQNKVNDINHPQ